MTGLEVQGLEMMGKHQVFVIVGPGAGVQSGLRFGG